MSTDELTNWIRYQNGATAGFENWATQELSNPRGAKRFARNFGPITFDEACAATDELDDREDQPKSHAAACKTVRNIVYHRRGKAGAPKIHKDKTLLAANTPAWLGFAKRVISEGETFREAIEYWQLHWENKAATAKHDPQKYMAFAWGGECERRIKVFDAFSELTGEDQARYVRRGAGFLPYIDEHKTGNADIDAQAVGLALFEAEQMPVRSAPPVLDGAVQGVPKVRGVGGVR